jgi:serine/threonine-protein kinase
MGEPASAKPLLEVGAVVAERYRVLEALGEGAMGAVYLVEHVHMRKRLALKVLREAVSANAEVVERFEREARAAAHIEHPNVATATDFGRTENGSFFLALEYVPGQSLRALVAQGPLAAGRAVDFAMQMASALAKAHSLGIVHRDLKPENVMIVTREKEPEQVKILDFGIARVPVEEKNGQALTQLGSVMGTPEYMAPEQALGEKIDARADLYSVGVMLYEMLTGLRPFDAADPVVLLGKLVTEAPPAMSARAPAIQVPAELDAIVMKLLSRDPKDRFASASDLAQALAGFAVAHGFLRGSSPAIPAAVASAPTMLASGHGSAPRIEAAPAVKKTGIGDRARAACEAARAWVTPRARALVERARPHYEAMRGRLPERARPAAPFLLGGVALLWLLIPVSVVTCAMRPSKNALALNGSGSSSSQPPPPPAPSARVREAAKAGPLALEDLAREYPQDQEIQRELVRVHTAEGRGANAMRALARLVALDAKWTRDPEMNEALHSALDGPFESSAAAIRVAESSFGERGVDILIDCAAMTGPAQKRCAESLAKPDVRAHASPAAAVLIDLREAKTCEEKKSVLDRAVAEGDGRALPLLRALTTKSGCGKHGRFDCWACLRKDERLDEAIAAIEQRRKKTTAASP